MKMTPRVKKILANYESDNPGTKANLARILMQGRLGGTGKMIVLPVDQGFEHGPARSFGMNPPGYDPHYHHSLAIDAGLNAYAAPLGALEMSSGTFAGQIPTILKINSGNSLCLSKEGPNQAVTGSIEDALRLGCSAIGFTIYPGSDHTYDMYEEIRELTAEAKACGLVSIIWAYPRGSMSKDGESAIDICGYSAHMACLLGAHIVKVKLPSDFLELPEAKKVYLEQKIPIKTMAERVSHVVDCCQAGRRMVIFSGGVAKDSESVLNDARAIRDGGGNGFIIGRNSFQRPREEALELLDGLVRVFKDEK
ncbi:MAG TPA: class I fructose-bisphosphate aldolase [Rhodospirillaceae bacterium]|nr:MAG: fructose-bisphosphate aldolase [Alphaproteobacteria bacterium GWF2_58_20]HAU29069.1 class I fructose-bisphosphate aldolase [Rhodospirillaceae bacterium]